jgi:hypothetical protein
VTAALFTLRVFAAGPIVGAALVCPEARYCSVRLHGAERLDRRFALPADWKALEAELQSLPSGPLPARSAIVRVLGPDRELVVTHLVTEDVEAGSPSDVAAVLDAKLKAQPL